MVIEEINFQLRADAFLKLSKCSLDVKWKISSNLSSRKMFASIDLNEVDKNLMNL